MPSRDSQAQGADQTGDTLQPRLKPRPFHVNADWHYEADGLRQHYLLEACVGGRVRGRAHGWFAPGQQLVLEKIEIDGTHRSQGYGSALIETLRAKARDVACSELVIRNVRASNTGAIRLYEALGAVASAGADDMVSFVLSPP